MKWTGVLALVVALVFAPAALAQERADDPAAVEAGMAIFEENCASCHNVDGSGSNAGRSLIDVALEQPDRSVHVLSVTSGKGGMPAFGPVLSPEEIDAAISYVRLTFVSAQPEEPVVDDSEEELADTGAESGLLVVVAVAVGAAGVMMMSTRRADA